MKYLKKFESFEMISQEEEMDEMEVCDQCGCSKYDDDGCDCPENSEYVSEKKSSRSSKSKKSKPDFLDLDKDGDRKEPMKKAAKEAKGKKTSTSGKGLSKAQMKLPPALRAAISKGLRD
jgi:hypothetical protein